MGDFIQEIHSQHPKLGLLWDFLCFITTIQTNPFMRERFPSASPLLSLVKLFLFWCCVLPVYGQWTNTFIQSSPVFPPVWQRTSHSSHTISDQSQGVVWSMNRDAMYDWVSQRSHVPRRLFSLWLHSLNSPPPHHYRHLSFSEMNSLLTDMVWGYTSAPPAILLWSL